MKEPFSFAVECLLPEEALRYKNTWLALEERGNSSFFVSWSWVESWLTVVAPKVQLLTARRGEQLVGMGFLVASRDRRHGVLLSRQLRLQQTGVQAADQIWSEYNEFLIDERCRRELYPQLMDFLVTHLQGWDELIVGVLEETSLVDLQHKDLVSRIIWEAPTYSVDLAALKKITDSYLDTLSRNTRYQIRRAIKKSAADGMIKLNRADSVEAAMDYLDAAASLHRKRWKSESGFDNPIFVDFHRHLIQKCWSAGVVELVQLSIDQQVFAVLYFYVYKNQVYFYLSGIDYEQAKVSKPGLVAHVYCIQSFLDRGCWRYDFMGGDAQYKRSLGRYDGKLVMAALQKKKAKFFVENKMRKLKRYLARR